MCEKDCCKKDPSCTITDDEKKLISTACVITVSDRGYRNEYEDASGPALSELLRKKGYSVEFTTIVPDEVDDIVAALKDAADKDIALIITSGGTGFAPRDVTPEATQIACEKMVPGIGEAMRAASMKFTPRGFLSRETAGIIHKSLVVNVPGSPRAAVENLESIIDPLEHGLLMLRGGSQDCAKLTD